MSEAGFQFELERSILFLLFMESENYLGEVRWAYMASDCAAYSIQKMHFNSSPCSKANWHYFSDREKWFLSFLIRLLMDSNWQLHFGKKKKPSSALPSSVNATKELHGRLEGDLRRILSGCGNGFLKPRAWSLHNTDPVSHRNVKRHKTC